MCGVIVSSMASCGDTGSKSADKTETSAETTTTQEETAAAEAGVDENNADAPQIRGGEDDAAETAAAETQETAAAPVNTLKEIGTLPGSDIYYSQNNAIFKYDSDNNQIFYDYKGNELGLDNVVNVEQLGDHSDLYSFTVVKDNMLYSSIINSDGEVILPISENVNLVKVLSNSDTRFVLCGFAGEETKNKAEAIIYLSNNIFGSLVGPDDDDKMYKGHFEIYDTVNKKFLKSINEKGNISPKIAGSLICYRDSNYNNVIVDAQKDIVVSLRDGQTCLGSVICERVGSRTIIYDTDQNQLFDFDGDISDFSATPDYFSCTAEKKEGIIDRKGNIVVAPEYSYVGYIGGGFFACGDDFNAAGLVDSSGNKLTDQKYRFYNYNPVFDVVTAKNSESNKDVLLSGDGTVILEADEGTFNSAPYKIKKDDGVYYYYCKNDKDFTIKRASSFNRIIADHYLIDNDNKEIYDLYTGQMIMNDFDEAFNAYSRLYIIKSDTTTIYKE